MLLVFRVMDEVETYKHLDCTTTKRCCAIKQLVGQAEFHQCSLCHLTLRCAHRDHSKDDLIFGLVPVRQCSLFDNFTEAEKAWVHNTQNLAIRLGKEVKAARRLDMV
jgi:hypothetical protein